MAYLFSAKFIRYIFSGVIASVSNLAILYLLVNGIHLWYLISAVISFSCGIIVGYLFHKFFTFKDYSRDDIPIQFSRFLIYNMVMLGINTLLMYIFVDFLGVLYIISQVIITVSIAFLNYFFFNMVIFPEKIPNR